MSVYIKLLFCTAIILGTSASYAKDLSTRLGVGFSDQFAINQANRRTLPSATVRYYPNADMGFSASLAVDTAEGASAFGFLAKMYRIIFPEDNMNFYMGAGIGIISEENGGTTESGFQLDGFAGGEFFFSGLESLGFSFEMGVGVVSKSSNVIFRTIGDHPVRAGITFYF